MVDPRPFDLPGPLGHDGAELSAGRTFDWNREGHVPRSITGEAGLPATVVTVVT
ncbi:MAG TPA: hypothetical protein VHF25_00030 [Nitriliruptorales bacterium]|nr:hypothetical protein [Nitriliruptorales bacterium]